MTPKHKSTGQRICKGLLILWLMLVAGLPAYYLMPARDWNYEDWGAPEEIVKSRMSWDNPANREKGVYARVFIVRPSAQNLAHFHEKKSTSCYYPMDELLHRYELPGPYRYGSWYGHGSMDYVECGNGLVLVRDYSRNKGGLFSSRMAWDTVKAHYPRYFVCLFMWASVGLVVLILTPFLLLFGALAYAIIRLILAFFRTVFPK